ncbi:hypothetical protein [Yinghuangia sp. YIM S09857]|uniref:hypothetical protein n=1 Tax=Yinghuangia sp. YIM S09857 TaxID=3436929 RepID=UPI003F538C9E
MNPPIRISPQELTGLAAGFDAAVPGLEAAREALRAAEGDPDLAASRSDSPGTWAAATAAVEHALAEATHLHNVVASTPGLLRSCAEGYATGDRLAAELLEALAAHGDPVPPLTLSEYATPPPPPPPPAAVVRDDAPAGQVPPFRVTQFTSPAVEFAAQVAGATRTGPRPASGGEVRRTRLSGERPPTGGAGNGQGAQAGSGTGRVPASGAGSVPKGTGVSVPGDVRRSEILRRAKRWADLGLDYSMSRTFEGHRMDCSGLVSMAWGLPAPGLTTDTLPQVSHGIDKDDLLPGDILVNTAPGAAGHTLIFAGWADAAHTRYFAYEESGGKGAHFGTVPYPYWPGHGTFLPYRMDALG